MRTAYRTLIDGFVRNFEEKCWHEAIYFIPLPSIKTEDRLAAGGIAICSERKVRATKDIPLPNGKRFVRA